MKRLALPLALFLTACASGSSPTPSPVPPTPPPAQTWIVSNGTLRVTASAAFGGCVVSVTDAHGNEYVNTTDHGREIQTAYQLDAMGEGDNPTECGSAADSAKPTSSTVIDAVAIRAPNILETTVHPAFWEAYGGASVSADTMSKRVTVGVGSLANVIRHDVSITLAEDHATVAVEGLTGYGQMLPNLYQQQPDGSFELAAQTADQWFSSWTPIIEASADGSQAIGVYSPGYGYGSSMITGAGVDKWDCAWWAKTPLPAGTYSYTCYVAVGTLAEVEAALMAVEGDQ